MKRYLILMSILTTLVPGLSRADDIIPKRTEFNRYSAMVARSPFAVASAPTPVSSTPSWSKDLFIANAAHLPESDLVTVMSMSDKNLKEYVSTEGPNDHGYGVANIEWSDNPGSTKVTVSKDGQFATIGFNEALMSQAAPPMPNAQSAPNIPGGRPMQQPVQQQPSAMPQPHVRGVIQRKPPSGVTPVPNSAAMTAPQS
ncbi:MAG: hypothetical protein ABI925_12465 [Verrucomicrobiota bacterium]